MGNYNDIGLDDFMNADISQGMQKAETDTASDWQDRSISLNQITTGILTGGTIQTDSSANSGVKINQKTGVDVYGVNIRFLDDSGNVGGMIIGLSGGGIQLYSTTGNVTISSGANNIRLTYGSMRWDATPTAESIAAATHYIVINMDGTDYKLMLKSI